MSCPEGPKRHFEGFISPRNCRNSGILNKKNRPRVSLGAILATASVATSLLGSRPICPDPDCLQTLLHVRIFLALI